MPRPMSRSTQLVAGMTIEELLAFHRGVFGDARMDDDPPERPSDVTQEEWDALGDPGRRALDRVRRAQRDADRARDAAVAAQTAAVRERDQARTELEKARKDAKPDDAPKDVAEQIKDAVAAAVQQVTQQFTEKIDTLTAAQAAERLQTRAQKIAGDVLIVPDLVGSLVDLSTMTDGQGALDEQALRDALATLIETRPELKRAAAPADPLGGHPGGARRTPDKATFDARVAEHLTIARASGLAVRSELAAAATSGTS